MIQFQLFLERNDLTNQLPQNFSFRVDNAIFLNLVDCNCAKFIFGRKVAFLGGTAKIWFVIIQNVNGKIRAGNIVFLFCF